MNIVIGNDKGRFEVETGKGGLYVHIPYSGELWAEWPSVSRGRHMVDYRFTESGFEVWAGKLYLCCNHLRKAFRAA